MEALDEDEDCSPNFFPRNPHNLALIISVGLNPSLEIREPDEMGTETPITGSLFFFSFLPSLCFFLQKYMLDASIYENSGANINKNLTQYNLQILSRYNIIYVVNVHTIFKFLKYDDLGVIRSPLFYGSLHFIGGDSLESS